MLVAPLMVWTGDPEKKPAGVNRRAVSLWPALRQARIDDDQADSIMTSVIDAFEPDDVIAQASSYGLFCPHILLRTTSNLLHINYDQLALTYCTAPWKTRKGIQTLLVTIALLSNSLS